MQSTPSSVNIIRPHRDALQAFKDVVFALVMREAKSRLNGRWSSIFWLAFEPLAHVIVLLLIFGHFRARMVPGVDFIAWLVWGLLPFFLFKGLALKLMEAIEVNRALFVYRPVQPIDAVVARGLLETLLGVLVYGGLLFVMGWFGVAVVPFRWLETLLWVSSFVLMGVSWGLLFAVLTTGYERVRLFIRLSFFPLYLLSGVIFPLASLPAELREWLFLNPLAHQVELVRSSALEGYRPVPEAELGYPLLCALGALALGLVVYRLRRHSILMVKT
jgi:capsular polysaccharide transport system permease protein